MFRFTLVIAICTLTWCCSGGEAAAAVKLEKTLTDTYKDYIYTLVTQPQLNQSQAIAACTSNGQELATAKTQEELDFLKALIKKNDFYDGPLKNGEGWWLNGHRDPATRNLVWRDDNSVIQSWFYNTTEKINFPYIPAEPSNFPHENCILLWNNPPVGHPFRGYDSGCDIITNFICKRPIQKSCTVSDRQAYCQQFCGDFGSLVTQKDFDTIVYCTGPCQQAGGCSC